MNPFLCSCTPVRGAGSKVLMLPDGGYCEDGVHFLPQELLKMRLAHMFSRNKPHFKTHMALRILQMKKLLGCELTHARKLDHVR